VTVAPPIAQLQLELVRAVHDRRDRWAVRMPRRLEEFSLRLTTLDDQLSGTLGRSPTVAELAKAAGVETGEAVRAIVAGRASTALSLSVPIGEDPDNMLGDTRADPEAVFSAANDRGFIARELESLEERERHIDHNSTRRWIGWRTISSFGAVLAVAALAPTAVLARNAAAPQNSSAPTISGTAREGGTLTANNGNWTNSPTSFAYQWQQCDAGGASCSNITSGTGKSYSVTAGDADHTLRVAVTASNADGHATASSKTTAVVSSAKAPVNTGSPSISGTAEVGQELSASNGTWTGGVQSYSYQWERCDSAGASCAAVVDATGRTYGVRTNDVGNTLRVVVTAKSASGSTNATSAATAVVKAISGGTTTVTKTVAGNRAPTISFVSLSRAGSRVYARFRVCDDSPKAITVIESDTKAHTLSYTRRYSIAPVPCGTHSKNWLLPVRFRHGRYTATLRAVDKSGASSGTVRRSLTFR
jgi:hypothetical protein